MLQIQGGGGEVVVTNIEPLERQEEQYPRFLPSVNIDFETATSSIGIPDFSLCVIQKKITRIIFSCGRNYLRRLVRS